MSFLERFMKENNETVLSGGGTNESSPCCCPTTADNLKPDTSTCSCSNHANQVRRKGLTMKVLGTGCKKCQALHANCQAAVNQLHLDIEVEYITDLGALLDYDVMSSPALVLNDVVISSGRLLNVEEVAEILNTFSPNIPQQ